MDAEERYRLVARNAEEIVTKEELEALLATKDSPRAYIGFEPSGLVHLGWALVASKIKDLVDADFEVLVFFADWHAYVNDKLGGDIDRIRLCARYMVDAFESLGVARDRVNYLLASKIMDNTEYWGTLMKVGKVTTLSRIRRAMTIMGRKEDDADLDSSKFLYPLMQVTDIFRLDIDLAYAGMDQRRAHMLAREAAEKLNWKVPVALHTPLLPGLKGFNRMDPLANKMSKSDPDSGILIHDTPEDIGRKISKAFCPPEAEGNPVLSIARLIIFPRNPVFVIERPEKFGGRLEFNSYEELEETYLAGNLHPMDLKSGVAKALSDILAPSREYFEDHPENFIEMKKSLGLI